MKERDIVLFLGAGFSRDAGLPLMKDFGKGSEREYTGLRKHLDRKQYRQAAPLLVEAAEVFKSFNEFCRKARTLSDKEANNLEIIYCIAESMYEAGQEHIYLNKNFKDQPFSSKELIKSIQLWLWKVYQQYPIWNQERETNREPYDRFFKIIKELEIVDQITVITTNYDNIFEYMSWEKNMPCVYPSITHDSFQAGHGSKPYIFLKEEDHPDKAVVCKLHGSINYFIDNNSPDDLYIANDLGNGKPIGRSGVWKDKPAIIAVDAIWNIRKKYGENYTPAIVPPTYAKLTGQEWLKKIWKKALDALSKAKKIIFIGYSMPDSDGFIHALIHSSMALRESKLQPSIFVLNPSIRVHKRFKVLFKNLIKKDTKPQSFDEATKNETFEEILNPKTESFL
jgi:NAD-dependent SIR2 family protein deacetylase